MKHRIAFSLGQVTLAIAGLGLAGCATEDVTAATSQAVDSSSVVGLAIEVDNGNGIALQLKQGQTFYLNQIDMRASLVADVDEGVSGLSRSGDFSSLHWGGTYFEEQEPLQLANADGTYTMRRFFRGASWMNHSSDFVLEQIDASGHKLAKPVRVSTGSEYKWKDKDDFFVRRFRAIQWVYDCVSLSDCTGAKSFQEEALIELRYAEHPEKTFTLDPRTTAFRLTWSMRPDHAYTIPVTQIANPEWSYGFNIDLKALTPPNPDGTYSPGSDITFQVTLEDGQGKRLAPEGPLPSYDDVIFGPNPSGVEYYRAFFDPSATYWRRKHRERNMLVEFLGPIQDAQPIRTVAPLSEFLTSDDVQLIGTIPRDGVYAQFRLFPTSHDLFGGAFDPAHAAWSNPVSDTWTNHVPDDAPPGTYYVTFKARRTYMGEDIPKTQILKVQIGTPTETHATLNIGGCSSCHKGPSAFSDVLHANPDLSSCAGCHSPLGFELEGPIYVRTHFIHSRSHRYPDALDNCSSCHLNRAGIQRVSKSACLSCHTSYPESHVEQFGPIKSVYVGGDGTDSFQQCTTACHRNHPNSHL